MLEICFDVFFAFWMAVGISWVVSFSIKLMADSFGEDGWLFVLGLFLLSASFLLFAVWLSIMSNILN